MAGPLPSPRHPYSPTFPRMSRSRTDFDHQGVVPEPTPAELGRLFHEEQRQMFLTPGLRVSESYVLQEISPYRPRQPPDEPPIDTRPWNDREGPPVDESSWFRLFRRDRWLSIHDQIPGIEPSLVADVDDPVFWGEFRKCIDLANRMLDQALNHEWLLSFLTRSTHRPEPNVELFLDGIGPPSKPRTIHRVIPLDQYGEEERKNAEAVLDSMTDLIAWGFYADVVRPQAIGTTYGCADSRYCSKGTKRYFTLLNLRLLSRLYQGEGEGVFDDPKHYQTQVLVAQVILHELMHAISGCLAYEKRTSELVEENKYDHELFYNDERGAEAGRSFEMSFFGSCCYQTSMSQPDFQGHNVVLGKQGAFNFMGKGLSGWYIKDNEKDIRGHVDTFDMLGIPGAATAAMASRDFWDVHVRRHGKEALRMVGVTKAETLSSTSLNRRAIIVKAARIAGADERTTGWQAMDDSVDQLVEALRLRRLHLKQARPWYPAAYHQWSMTPYVDTTAASSVDELRRCGIPVSNNWEDLHKLREAADTLLLMYRWDGNFGVPRILELNRTPQLVFWGAVGMLTMATIPSTGGTFTCKKPVKPTRNEVKDLTHGRSCSLDQKCTPWINESVRGSFDRKHSATTYTHTKHSKERSFHMAEVLANMWKVRGVVPTELASEYDLAAQIHRSRLESRPADDFWDAFVFRVPMYTATFLGRDTNGSSVQVSQESDLPADAVAMSGVVSAPMEVARVRYFTPGEIGDRQRIGEGVKWVLRAVDDEEEVEVYRAADKLKKDWTKETRARYMLPGPELAPFGWMVRRDTTGGGNEHVMGDAIGRAMIPRRPEDVRLNDGSNGRPKWIEVISDVYDVTNIELPPDMSELEQILRYSVSINPVSEAINDGWDPRMVLEQLRPYKIGWTKNSIDSVRRKDRVFTANEVRWHAFRETGMFLIINGKVYDFTEYCDLHPGGSAILEEWAGLDATTQWNQAHGNNDSAFGLYPPPAVVLEKLCIGRVVPEQHEKNAILKSQIKLGCYVFSYDNTSGDFKRYADQNLQQHRGASHSNTTTFERSAVPTELATLWENPDCIVAKAVPDLPGMEVNILKLMNGEETDKTFQESYICDGEFVYNMTSFIRYSTHPPEGLIDALKAAAGRVLGNNGTDPRLKQYLCDRCRYRRIARLEKPSHAHTLANLDKGIQARDFGSEGLDTTDFFVFENVFDQSEVAQRHAHV
ncbi:putative cytochrome b5 [Colletotrichum trifolii]|uniref:Putative cytochrome b5 n=1 Tax=Colletotrichum trifolii TaxID=5466 RepID=A0A4R8RSI5_COLTR|nr:putative cytochrome b5 [Colletotrichum trifolii]